MKEIIISKNDIGSCVISSKEDIPGTSEFIIKSLACLQLLFLSKINSNDKKTKDMQAILTNAIHEMEALYDVGDSNETDIFK